jgi:uncharacterized protein YidB (DUF937 family)
MGLLDQVLGQVLSSQQPSAGTVFGENQVQNMARQAGMALRDLLSQLGRHLPSVVDGMTKRSGA